MSDSEVHLASGYMDAANRAVQYFPIEAMDIQPVMESENVTFKVSVRDEATQYVLRLHRPGYNSLKELESERMWVQALEQTEIPVPGLLRTREGQHFVPIDMAGTGKQRFAGMTTWLPGQPLVEFMESGIDDAERIKRISRIGEIAAVFNNQSARWSLPAGFTRRRLDLDSLLGANPFWGRFWEHPALGRAERQLLLRTRRKLAASIEQYGEQPDSFSLIHADLTLDNLIYDGHDLAVIDFDDCAFGWHLHDLTAMLIECVHEPDFEDMQDAMLAGYRRKRELKSRDIDRLPDFLLVRGMAIIGWFYQRPEVIAPEYFENIKRWVLETCASRD